MKKGGNEKDERRQSNFEKKSQRERQRRSEMNEAFDDLANTLYDVQPLLNSIASKQTDNEGSNDNPNHGSTTNELEDKISNRVDLTLYTVEVLKQLQKEKDTLKNELSSRIDAVGVLGKPDGSERNTSRTEETLTTNYKMSGRGEERQGSHSGNLPAQASSLVPMSSNQSESLNLLSSNERSLDSQHLQRVSSTQNTNSIQGLSSHNVTLPSPSQNQNSLIVNELLEEGLPQNSPQVDSSQVEGECDTKALTYKQKKQKKDR